ncbi:hypothetical protein L484_023780 [Morus notabilis]|uniref:Uncharacterized protein n=1 Tax=Morus notabilis TaxID=981085 RepID=W9RCW1_9ROSA|nr:hypothetical protein L484_023780 [Morus notabilis]
MSWHIIITIIAILSGLIQVKFQSKTSSPFDEHPWIMVSFLSVIIAYGVVEFLADHQTQNNINNTILVGLVKETRHNLGALACIFLLHIISPVLGWVITFLFSIYVLKKLACYYNVVDYIVTIFTETVKNAFLKICDKYLKPTPEDESPVSNCSTTVAMTMKDLQGQSILASMT